MIDLFSSPDHHLGFGISLFKDLLLLLKKVSGGLMGLLIPLACKCDHSGKKRVLNKRLTTRVIHCDPVTSIFLQYCFQSFSIGRGELATMSRDI